MDDFGVERKTIDSVLDRVTYILLFTFYVGLIDLVDSSRRFREGPSRYV